MMTIRPHLKKMRTLDTLARHVQVHFDQSLNEVFSRVDQKESVHEYYRYIVHSTHIVCSGVAIALRASELV